MFTFEHQLSTVKAHQHNILCSIGSLKGKNGKGMHTHEKQLKGRQKNRRVITKKEGTKIVIDPSLPLTRYYYSNTLGRRLQEAI